MFYDYQPLFDDRDEPCKLLSVRDLRRASQTDRPALAGVARTLRTAIKAESGRTTPGTVAMQIGGVIGAVVLTPFVAIFLVEVLGAPAAVMPLVFIALLAAGLQGPRLLARARVRKSLALTAVAEGVCGSCAFSLEGVAPERDDRLVCPECGAAWRADRVTRPHWKTPTLAVNRQSFACWITPGVCSVGDLVTPDDRGRFVPTPDARLRRLRSALRDEIEPDECRRIRKAMRRIGRTRRALLTLVLLTMPTLFAARGWSVYRHESAAAGGVLLGVAAGLAAVVLIVPCCSIFCSPRATSRLLVNRFSRCGSCMKPIATPPADKLLVCSRCGAAWNLAKRA